MPESARSINKIAGAWSLCNFSRCFCLGKNTEQRSPAPAQAHGESRRELHVAWVTGQGWGDIPCQPHSETRDGVCQVTFVQYD